MFLTFGSFGVLFLLLGVPVVFFAHFFFRRNARVRGLVFSNFSVLERALGRSFFSWHFFRLLVFVLVYSLLVFVLARPVLWVETDDVGDVVFAVDTSASMLAKDFNPDRFSFALDFVRRSLKVLPSGARVGLVTFDSVVRVELLPTQDHSLVSGVLDSLKPSSRGGTDIGGAVFTSVNLLLGLNSSKSVFLVSDGAATSGAFLDSLSDAGEYAKSFGVVVHSVGVGRNAAPVGFLPSYYNVSSVFNPSSLELLSNITGGVFLDMRSLSLDEAVSKIPFSPRYRGVDLSSYLLFFLLLVLVLWWVFDEAFFPRFP